MIRKLHWKFVGIMMTIVTILLCIIFVSLYYVTKNNYRQESLSSMRTALMDNYPAETGNGPGSGIEAGAEAGPGSGIEADTEAGPGSGAEAGTETEPGSGAEAGTETEPGSKTETVAEAGSAGKTIPQPRNRDQTPMLVVAEKADGTYEILRNQLYQIDGEEAGRLVGLVKAAEESDREGLARSGELEGEHLRYSCGRRGPGGTLRYVFADTMAEEQALKSQALHSLMIGIGAFGAFFCAAVFLSSWALRPVQQAWERQRQFVADASHELKTPLTVILSNINLLNHSGEAFSEENAGRLEFIEAEARRMRYLVEGLLTLARSDAGKEERILERVDLSFTVNSSIAAFEPVFFEMGKGIETEVEENLYLSGDGKRLRQLTDILLDNAGKYSREHSTIFVTLSRRAPESAPQELLRHGAAEKVFLTVASEGTPLTREQLSQIFNRFYRADASRGRVSGYGLGLSIARSIAEEHGGRIAASTDGIGKNVFTVVLSQSLT